jgi:hypothetical protein
MARESDEQKVKTTARKAMWAGRATVLPVGRAMISALAVGLVSSAPAGVGVGARFEVGP